MPLFRLLYLCTPALGDLAAVLVQLIVQRPAVHVGDLRHPVRIVDDLHFKRLGGAGDNAVAAALALVFLDGHHAVVTVDGVIVAALYAHAAAQPASLPQNLWILYCLVPALGVAIGVPILSRYKLRDKIVNAITLFNQGKITREEAQKTIGDKI